VDVFLFDEPLSNLDAKLRADLRVEIKRLHQKLNNTMIYVTHDQVEAMTLADRIAIMKEGIIQQLDSPAEIYNRPVNKYVADFIGSPAMNFLSGDMTDQGKFVVGGSTIDLKGYTYVDGPVNGPVWFGFRPEHAFVGEGAQSQPVTFQTVAEIVEPMGSDTLVWTSIENQPFRMRMDGQARISTGDQLTLGFDPARASIFDKKTELRV